MRRGPVIALALVLVVAACGSDDDTSVDAGDDGARPTIEGDYIAVEVTEDGQPRPLVEGTELTLRLEDGRIGASAGCNSMSGPYELEDGVLRVSDLAMTEMGCDDARHDQDAWVADLLLSEPTVEPVEEGFVLRSGSRTVDFRDHSYVTPDAELVGTTWVVDTILEGSGPDGTASSVPWDEPPTLRLEDNGFVMGSDGCNGFGWGGEQGQPPSEGVRYTVDGGEIIFAGDPVADTRACPDVDVDLFWRVIDGTVSWEIDASRLTLSHPDGFGLSATATG